MADLSPTAKAILGILAMGPASGYEIKQIVDDSTRFFWAASYGQIYPELKRLEKRGLIAGSDEPTGGRSKTTWKLTAAGRRSVKQWLEAPAEVFEMRNEGMLKLFVAEWGGAGDVEPQVAEMAAHSDEVVAQLGRVRDKIESEGGEAPVCLRLGISLNEFIAEWCRRTLAEMEQTAGGPGRRKETDVQRTR